MIEIRQHAWDNGPLAALHSALNLRIGISADAAWTTAACVVRRLAAVHAPCPRRQLVAQASHALAGALADDATTTLHEIVDDLIAGGDLTEQVGLRAGTDEAPVLIFLTAPRFARAPHRIYLRGVAADDAPCIPRAVSADMISAGSMRYLHSDDVDSSAELLRKLGLDEEALDHNARADHCLQGEALIARYRVALASGDRLERAEGFRWLAPGGDSPYHRRWSQDAAAHGLQIGRVPQFFGADAWIVADHSAKPARFAHLPLRDLRDDRGCDAAWRLQLAIDSDAGAPAHYQVQVDENLAHLKISFPLPQRERARLLHLGGIRPSTARPYDFCLPRDALLVARQVLDSLGFSPSTESVA
ncbi:hypothetical protein [Dokdonella immobilis]|uniref:Uncharacterized protein n=1 Tax=Dokdonella immobilis TaxID=578942 RepID=A0A1I4ZRV8_9GAMM|nr:hypothetical protein [Dokdonella immobilis]SFN52720.1 hypothetical protein SAMN05216289_12814 [Dokdonella immobilis]